MQYEVVVAEDEELLLHNLSKKINATPDFHVAGEAQTGLQALALAEKILPTLLVTDIRMPVMDGMELLTKVRDRFPDMKLIIVSGFSDFAYAKEAIHLKVYDYLLKPLSQENVSAVLNRLRKTLELERNDYLQYFSTEQARLSGNEIAGLLHDFIGTHYQKPLNLNVIAQTMNYSQSYLSKVFIQKYGCPPIRYLNQIRLQKACYLLTSHPELTINQIAELIGYENQAYFSRIFKKHKGISPLQYRKNTGRPNV